MAYRGVSQPVPVARPENDPLIHLVTRAGRLLLSGRRGYW